jgi:plastocyanin
MRAPWTRVSGVIAAAICGASLLSSGCISERSEGPTGPGGGSCIIPADALGANKVVIALRNFAFLPDTIYIAAGTTVTWVNCELPGNDAHTTTADGGTWTSGFLGRGESYSRLFGQAGTFDYHCEPHPFMTGVVVVQ